MLFLTTSGPLLLIACSALPCPPYHTLINPLWLGLQRSAGLLRSLQPSSLAFVAPTGELYEVQVLSRVGVQTVHWGRKDL